MSLDFYLEEKQTVSIFEANITHNLTKMAAEADLYESLWRPHENGIYFAGDLIESLEKGITLLRSDPERFKKFDALNGWGKLVDFLPFLEKILKACKENPKSRIRVSK